MLELVTLVPWWASPDHRVQLFAGDSLEIMRQLPDEHFDLIFADPPYFLSNGGTTMRSGQRAPVEKGEWDRSHGARIDHEFNMQWLFECRRLLSPSGTIWVSGTMHVIFSVGFALQCLGFRLLNDVAWEKPNPPPNMGCRCFVHAHETLLWAAKSKRTKYHFDYAAMKAANGNKQERSVWRMTAPTKAEKKHGKHPTQKPLAVLDRIVKASMPRGGRVLDPFNGSGTTGVAAVANGATEFVGIDRDYAYLALARRRIQEVLPCNL